MQVVYSFEPMPSMVASSIFLAGPTPRPEKPVPSWRPAALRVLEGRGYEGTVFVPEFQGGELRDLDGSEKARQILWENEALHRADCILFWIPRDLDTMPAFTTNHEHGEWFQSGKIVLGAPKEAAKMEYLYWKARYAGVPQSETLEGAIDAALALVGEGAARSGGECQVPLHIWRTPSFHGWYGAQQTAGNRLERASVEWVYRVGREKKNVFLWALRVTISVAAEHRSKTEVVLARPDISAVVLYRKSPSILDTPVVLVREVRCPAVTLDGYVWEVPGGPSYDSREDPKSLAAHEVEEETGLALDPARFRECGSRQLLGTLSAHKANLFAAELSESELRWLGERAGVPQGVAADTERTWVEIRTVRDIITGRLVDWSNIGMIFQALA